MTVWTVPGDIVKVVDGDSLHIDLDLGWQIKHMNALTRLQGLDAPKGNTLAGMNVTSWVIEYLGELPVPCTIISHSLDKYGRTLAVVFTPKSPISLNELII